MMRKSIYNQIELKYCAISNFEFTILKDDQSIIESLKESSIYAIAQRPIIRFDGINLNEENLTVEFQIRQNGNPNTLDCKLPLKQERIEFSKEENLVLSLFSINKNQSQTDNPLDNNHGIVINEESQGDSKFLVWLSPEKLLYEYWNDQIHCEIIGDQRSFLKYRIHYVGKATEQDVFSRLTGHSTLQEILSLENPFHFGDLPTHEIVILFLGFRDNIEFKVFDYEDNPQEISDSLMGKFRPSKRRIFLDSEKALVKAIQPKYNKILFKNYPKSSDGLSKDKYDSILYTFMDPITLVYDHGVLEGGLDIFGGDSIMIQNDKDFTLFKKNNSQDL